MRVRVYTIGHGIRPADELIATLEEAGVRTVVDVRRIPRSRRNPQFNQEAMREPVAAAGIEYRHEVDLGGLRENEPGEERFACIRVPAFRSYAARMGTDAWEAALARTLSAPTPCLMCAETSWLKCHRRMICELLAARGHEVVHLIRPGERELHVLRKEAEGREGRLYLCGHRVA
jgi:uncharacterized protein (DUF488 family)